MNIKRHSKHDSRFYELKEEKMKTESDRLFDLQGSSEYADFIMENAKGDHVICNGDSLTEAMEYGYLFEEFLASINEGRE